MDRVGQRVGHYSLIRLLGIGGFAEVYLGEHLHLNTLAAVKILRTHLSEKEAESFQIEARTIARLVHPHIVRILDYGLEGTMPFLIMDYAPGGTLREKHPRGTKLPPATISSYLMQLASALQFAHDSRLIHRDVKPENMLLRQHNEILLSDFGIALVAPSSLSQNLKPVAGTISYMAPEQLQGKPRLASDQYALGMVVYEWLCGSCPFSGSFVEIASQHVLVPPPPLRQKGVVISTELEQVVVRALAKEPRERFPTIQAFALAFERACQPSLPASISSTIPASPNSSSSVEKAEKRYSIQRNAISTPPQEESLSSSRTTQNIAVSELSTMPLSEKNAKVKRYKFPTPRQKLTKRSLVFVVGVALLVVLASTGFLSPTLTGLLSTLVAHRTPTPSEFPVLTISIQGEAQPSNIASYGQTIILQLRQFPSNDVVLLTHDIEEPLQIQTGVPSINIGKSGAADIAVEVDTSWQPGFHTLQAEDQVTRYTASAKLLINSGPRPPPHLLVRTPELDFGAAVKGVNSIQPVTLENSGSGVIDWSASSNQPWLMLTPTQGVFSDSQTIAVAVERTLALSPKEYTGKITFSSNVGTAIVMVKMAVRALPANVPVLSVAPPVLSFVALDGGADPALQQLVVSNPGSEPLSWALTNDTPTIHTNQDHLVGGNTNWLALDRVAGTVVPGATMTIPVRVHSHNLLPGTYINTLVFSAGHGTGDSPQNVGVSLTVQPRCGLVLSTGSMAFTVVSGRNNLSAQTLSLSATANCENAVDWQATPSTAWIIISSTQGQVRRTTTGSRTTIGVNATNLRPGTYTGIALFVGGQNTQTLLITLVVQPSPSLSTPLMVASPLNLDFSTTQGQPPPPGQTVTLTNAGQDTLQWHTTINQLVLPWLSASPIGGSIPPGQTEQVRVNIDSTNLTPGSYMGQVVLEGTDAKDPTITAEGSPQTVTVNLLVLPPCTLAQPSSSALGFSATQGGADPAAQSLAITASGNCAWPLRWQAKLSKPTSWLRISPMTGSFEDSGQPAMLTVAPSVAGLRPGTYTAQIPLTAIDSSLPMQGSPQTFSVSFTVS